MNKYYRDIILIGIYGFCVVCQLIFSSYLINKKNDLTDILQNYKNIDVCKNDAIYRLNNGELINNTMAILISSSIIIGSFIMLFFYKILSKRNDYQTLDDSLNSLNSSEQNESIISRKLITLEKFDMTIHMIFIMSIICFVICNGIQFVFQINNISESCIHYIDNRIENFYTIYKFMTCIDFMTSYALFFIIPCFI
jgi:hypothetical protein